MTVPSGCSVACVAYVFVGALVACNHNPDYCPGAPKDNCNLIDATMTPDEGGPTGCSSNTQCTAPTAVCDIPTTTCVQCTSSEASACSGTSPYCGSGDSCRGCEVHAECSSDVCLPVGSCGTDTNVAYVDPFGTDNTTCTKAMPCTKVAKALATGRGGWQLEVGGLGVIEKDLVVADDARIKGVVVDREDHPIAGATVSAEHEPLIEAEIGLRRTDETGVDGAFELHVAPGDYKLEVEYSIVRAMQPASTKSKTDIRIV